MKILNWMQRKLYPATDYSRFSPKKSPAAFEEDTGESSAGAAEATEAESPLLRQVLDGNILTIGTLGYPLFLLLIPHSPEEEHTLESPPQEEPPVQPKPASGPMARTLSQTESKFFMKKEAEHSIDAAEEKIMAEAPLLKGDREMKERITLAELFAADPSAPAKLDTSKISSPAAKSVDKEKKEGKKKKKGDEVDSPQSPAAAKRLHRMITRMVKKKIHPEAVTAGKKVGGSAFSVAEDPLLLGSLGGGGGGGGGGVP